MPNYSNQIPKLINEAFIDNIVKEEVQNSVFYNPFNSTLLFHKVKFDKYIDPAGVLVALNPYDKFVILGNLKYERSNPASINNTSKDMVYKIADKAISFHGPSSSAMKRKVADEFKNTGTIKGYLILVNGETAWLSHYDYSLIKRIIEGTGGDSEN